MAMRIAMVTSWRVPCGIARYAEELVAALQELPGCQVTVLPVGLQVWKEQKRPLGWWWERRYWREVAAEAKGVDLVHIQFAPHFFGGLKPFRNLLPFFLRCLPRPAVITVHEVDLSGPPTVLWLKRWVQKSLFRSEKVLGLIALTQFVAGQLRALGYERVHVLPFWVPSLPDSPSAAKAKRKLGVSGRFIVVVFGFIVARRGYETLLKALPLLPREALLVFVGGPHPLDRTGYYLRLLARIAEHPHRRQIHVTGFLSEAEVDEWLAAADVVAAPFRALSGSASLMRALAHGKPIVASDLPPLKELAEQSGAVVLVPPDNPPAWAEVLTRLWREKGWRGQLSEAAKKFAAWATVHRVAEAHRALYDTLLRSERAANVLS